MPLVNSDRLVRRKPPPQELHIHQIAANRVGNANDLVDPGVQIGRPGSRIEYGDVRFDATVGNEPDRQTLAGAQAVGYGLVIKRVQNVELAFEQASGHRTSICTPASRRPMSICVSGRSLYEATARTFIGM